MNVQTLFVSMLPEHVLLAGLCLVMLVDVVASERRLGLALAIATVALAGAAAAMLSLGGYAANTFVGQLSVSPATSAAKAIVLLLAVPVLMLSRDEFADASFPLLVLASLYGGCLMISADSFLTLLLGIEILSLPVYVLVLLAMQRRDSPEAALKYLVLGGTATGMLLMGASLLFGWSGTLSINAFAQALDEPGALPRVGVGLIVSAFFLKAAVFPFHAWAPDAYEGASVPATAYMTTIVKATVLLAVVRLFGSVELTPSTTLLVAVPPLVSIVWGNVTAMRQSSYRRMIAYSSIAHAGFLFFALLGSAEGRFQAVAFYIAAYGLMNLLAFTALPRDSDDVHGDKIASLRGLFAAAPLRRGAAGARDALAGRHPADARLRRQVPRLPQRGRGRPSAARGARPAGELRRPVLLPARDHGDVHEPRRGGRRRDGHAAPLRLRGEPGVPAAHRAGHRVPRLGAGDAARLMA